MRQHLGVGLRAEIVPGLLEVPAQHDEVLDDAVVNDADAPRAVGMGMSVHVRGRAVGGPAGVADAHAPDGLLAVQHLHEVAELAGGAPHGQLTLRRDDRDARRVVAAVLQALEPVEQYWGSRPSSRVSYDATHDSSSSHLASRRRAPAGVSHRRASRGSAIWVLRAARRALSAAAIIFDRIMVAIAYGSLSTR